MRTLPEGWDIAIHSRASCILESLGLQHDREQNWFQLVSLLSEQTNGDFYSWLAITGRYPTKLEIERFRSKILLNGLNFAVQVLIQNQAKHHVSFLDAQAAFADPHRVIAKDLVQSEAEECFYCIGKAGGGILTVRFTYRRKVIRIIGAGYWHKGKAMYEKEDRLHG